MTTPYDTIRSVTWLGPRLHTLCMSQSKKTQDATLAGERIKRAYEITGWDRAKLAEKSEILYSTIGNYEQGTRMLPVWQARRMGDLMGIPPAFLVGLVDEDDMELLRASADVRRGFLSVIRGVSDTKASAPPAARTPFLSAVPLPRRGTKRRR